MISSQVDVSVDAGWTSMAFVLPGSVTVVKAEGSALCMAVLSVKSVGRLVFSLYEAALGCSRPLLLCGDVCDVESFAVENQYSEYCIFAVFQTLGSRPLQGKSHAAATLKRTVALSGKSRVGADSARCQIAHKMVQEGRSWRALAPIPAMF